MESKVSLFLTGSKVGKGFLLLNTVQPTVNSQIDLSTSSNSKHKDCIIILSKVLDLSSKSCRRYLLRFKLYKYKICLSL